MFSGHEATRRHAMFLEKKMLIEAIVALGFAVPPIICALAAYRRAHAAVIWAKRRHPRAAEDTGSLTGE